VEIYFFLDIFLGFACVNNHLFNVDNFVETCVNLVDIYHFSLNNYSLALSCSKKFI